MNLWQRVAVALVGIPVAIAAVWTGPPALVILLALIGAVCWLELAGIAGISRIGVGYHLGTAAAALGPAALWWRGAEGILIWLIVLTLGVTLWRLLAFEDSSLAGVSAIVFGSVYIGLGLGAGLLMRMLAGGRWLLIYLLIIIWVADTSAFAIGKALGRTKLAPKLSPGKTWEGAVGSGLVVVAVALLLPGTAGLRGIVKVIFALVVWLAALAGDLFESSMKREAGLKDSGSMLPGHGGFLDRLDSLLLAAPAAYIYLLLIGVN